MYIRDLLKSDAVLILELIHLSTACIDTESFKKLLEKMRCMIPHDYCAAELAMMKPDRTVETSCLVNINFPWEYMVMYQRDNWRKIDPIQRDAVGQPGARYWADIFKEKNPPRWMHSAAWDFKIKDGYTQAIWNKKKSGGSLFYFSGHSVKQEERTELILSLTTPHLHQAFTRIFVSTPRAYGSLSGKELEVLRWVSWGKSTWDISVILGISERTVKFHIGNIMHKLDASSRTHAVAIAMEQKLIDIE